jgi:hypothetical protein
VTKVKIYYPAATILPEYTDERLNGPDTPYKGEVRELLLTIPAAYRQAAMVEEYARTVGVAGEGDEVIEDIRATQRAVIAEIQAQLSGGA